MYVMQFETQATTISQYDHSMLNA